MSLSSWLFGKKKSAPETDSPSGSKPEDSDDFIMIEGHGKKQEPMYPDLGGLGRGSLPYQVQPMPRNTQNNTSHGIEALSLITSNPLDDVPFKLSSRLDSDACSWTASDVAHFKSLLSRVANLNETYFTYDFSNEETILREENQTAKDIG